ncbi:nuclear transport factor 2 family protein [Nonlabens antarcticus]|uniref:nuclear transport factor 2 family protein n=1 Tax=Nonlabens antarcticus TaxID=392714 RepID=UPI0018913A79|nr:nuclear transport factor 2 family protein [Nonlabens antarcticus]
MRSIFLSFILVTCLTSCSTYQEISKPQAGEIVDQWHKAAADADFDTYFNLMTSNAVFIGTEATENWQLKEFKAFSKPFFDRGKAWSFTSLQRNIYSENEVVYFDELLDTQMGICRGSGILKKENGSYRIAHYVLSIAVPNDNVDSLTEMKKEWDQKYIDKLQTRN